jgi:hypothetical protein
MKKVKGIQPKVLFGVPETGDDGKLSLSVIDLPDDVAESFWLKTMLLLADLMTAFERTGVAEIVRDGVTYRLRDLRDLGDDRFAFRIEILPTARKERKQR